MPKDKTDGRITIRLLGFKLHRVARAAIGEMYLRHVAAEPVAGVQRCGRCQKMLVEYGQAMTLDTDTVGPLYFPIGAELVEGPGSLATASEAERREVSACGAVH